MNRITSWLRLIGGFFCLATGSMLTFAVLLLFIPWRATRVRICNYFGKVMGPTLLWFAGAKPVVRGRELLDGSAPAIYVTNHTSTSDMFTAIWLCPIGGCGVAKKEVGNVPFFGWLYRLSGHLLIDRENRQNAIAALSKTAEFVKKNGLSMWIWPEGTRSRDGRLLPLKKGFAHLAIATGLPVVPVVVHGAHKGWEARTTTLHPMTLEIDVLPPIDTSRWTPETLDAHCEEVHRVFARALKDDQKPGLVPARSSTMPPSPSM